MTKVVVNRRGPSVQTDQSGSSATDQNIQITDNTINDVSVSKHGFAPKLPGSSTLFLNGNGQYTVPQVGAGGSSTQIQYNNGGVLGGFGSWNGSTFGIGTLGYTDTGINAYFQSSTNSYNQVILQNTSAGAAASTNFNVSNDQGTATTNFGEFGINSSGFTGTGSFSQAGNVYLASASTDLVIGTYANKSIRLVVNSGATDAVTISGAGAWTFNGSTTAIWKSIFAGLGTTQTDGAGEWLANTTAAAAGAQQISPSTTWEGQGWKTTATAASQSVKFTAYVLPVQGTTNPTGTWTLSSSINGGAYGTSLTYTSFGHLILPTATVSGLPTAGGMYFNGTTYVINSGSTISNIVNSRSGINPDGIGGTIIISDGGTANTMGVLGASNFMYSGGSVALGATTVTASALFAMTSTTKGFLPPRMTTTQRDAISSPAAGLVIYNTTTNKLNVFTTVWEAVTSA